jgi:hypothetical protein
MEYYDDDEDGTTYRLPNDWIQRYIESVPEEGIDDTEPIILKKIKNKRTVILNDYEVSYICEPVLISNYHTHMELIRAQISKKIKAEEDRQELKDLIEEMKEILDNMKVFDDSSGYSDADRDFMEIEEAAKKLLSGGSLTKEEEEYYQPDVVKDIKRVGEYLEELDENLKVLKTRTPAQLEQMERIGDDLVRNIMYCGNLYPDWKHLDYYRKLALQE